MTASSRERIRAFVHEDLLPEAGVENVSYETSLVDNGVIDSLAIVRLVLFLESEFGIRVRDEEVVPASFESIDAISSFVEAKLGSRTGSG